MVQIYMMDTSVFEDETLYQEVLALLPEQRKNKIKSLKREQEKKLSVAAGFLLLYGLWREKLPMMALQIGVGEHGKPYLEGEPMLCFNLSHSKTKAACVISDKGCGIDLEQIREKQLSDTLLRKVCSKEENLLLEKLEANERKSAFYQLWTGKESVMKKYGQGMRMDPQTIDVRKLLEGKQCKWGTDYLTPFFLENYCLTVCSEENDLSALQEVDGQEVRRFLQDFQKASESI